jgi:hypothetical protein
MSNSSAPIPIATRRPRQQSARTFSAGRNWNTFGVAAAPLVAVLEAAAEAQEAPTLDG